MASLCIWFVMGCVGYFEYQNKKQYLTTLITNRVEFAVGNIFMNHERGRDIKPFMDWAGGGGEAGELVLYC